MITFLKRMYLVFILFPLAIIYALLTMLYVIIQHIIDMSIIRIK
jgi:hypothetical protein